MMKQEILEVIKKYIDIDEKAIDVRLTNKESEDGSVGAPALYANIPIITIKNEARKMEGTLKKEEIDNNKENTEDEISEEKINEDESDIVENKEVEDTTLKDSDQENSEILKEDNNEIEKGQSELDINNINEVDDEEKNS